MPRECTATAPRPSTLALDANARPGLEPSGRCCTWPGSGGAERQVPACNAGNRCRVPARAHPKTTEKQKNDASTAVRGELAQCQLGADEAKNKPAYKSIECAGARSLPFDLTSHASTANPNQNPDLLVCILKRESPLRNGWRRRSDPRGRCGAVRRPLCTSSPVNLEGAATLRRKDATSGTKCTPRNLNTACCMPEGYQVLNDYERLSEAPCAITINLKHPLDAGPNQPRARARPPRRPCPSAPSREPPLGVQAPRAAR